MANKIRPRIPRINWNNPLTKGLVFCQPCFERGLGSSAFSVQELVFRNNGGKSTSTNQPGTVTDLIGNMLVFDGSSPGPAVVTPQNSQQRSLLQRSYCLFANRQGAASVNVSRMISESDGAVNSITLTDTDNTNTVSFVATFSTTNGSWSVTQNTLKVLNFWVITYDGSSVSNAPSIWLNGVAQTVTLVQAPVGSQTFNDTNMILGNWNQSGNAFSRTFNGRLSDLCKWNRVLNASEIASLSSNPFQLYSPTGLLTRR